MNISHLNIGILHSLIGKNDGVSIVIDQTVHAMVNDMGIELGNIFFLAAHTSPRFNAETDEVFWHKNVAHKIILKYFSSDPPEWLDQFIYENALYAKDVLKKFIKKHNIDLLIAHNTSHPLNFVTAVGLGLLFEEYRNQGLVWPKLLVWWHDSYFERERFQNPNHIIEKYLKYLPGTYIDGIAFINSLQPELAKRLFKKYNKEKLNIFFKHRSIVVHNTSSIDWEWKNKTWNSNDIVFPEQDNYNFTFLRDVGLLSIVESKGFDLNNTIILLQHTRIVPRKKIELAIDFAFKLEEKFLKHKQRKCFTVLISGHSGDEQVQYKEFLTKYYKKKKSERKDTNVLLIFGESCILSHRDIIVDKKYYNFYEVPSIIASYGGIGTYFSDVEGYGNNLLEMISFGLPVFINEYEIYKKDIKPFGFHLPAIENGQITSHIVDSAYKILTNITERNKIVKQNLVILNKKLDHSIIAKKLTPLIFDIFTRKL